MMKENKIDWKAEPAEGPKEAKKSMQVTYHYDLWLDRDTSIDVVCEHLQVHSGGTLVFWSNGEIDVVYAPGSYHHLGFSYKEEVR